MHGNNDFRKPFFIVLTGLVCSIFINLLTLHRSVTQRKRNNTHYKIDDTHYSEQRYLQRRHLTVAYNLLDTKPGYIDDDHPNRLPIHLPPVALVIEDTTHYGISNPDAWPEWRSTDYFPRANGFVRLGPDSRLFGVSMFHQMHCLQMLRDGVLQSATVNAHTHHCFNLLRQAILCASDTTLDQINDLTENSDPSTDGLGTVHVCRDWQAVYNFVTENQRSTLWSRAQNSTI